MAKPRPVAKKRFRTSSSELTAFFAELQRRPGFEVVHRPGSGHYHVRYNNRRVAVVGAGPTDTHSAIKTARRQIERGLSEQQTKG